ncbi:hypothetical protein [uncultured Aliiroseovarius sp.]|uniref:hypothetical protein n=1 Tax=uncultured Aliiroseovarius sp. TaxID=1658783 RepID=UPI0026173DF7|nr:hypothetical protein [uncultured Aliiroseovarius sp.]
MSALAAEVLQPCADDIEDILNLLGRVWPQLYGATGCPAFSAGYLKWLYSGPDAEKNHLLGFRDESGELIAFKAALFRSIRISGEIRSAWLTSHLAIAPELPFARRMEVSAALSRLHGLDSDEKHVNIAYFEADKPIARNARRLAVKAGLEVAEQEFAQHIVNLRKLRAFDAGTDDIQIAELTQNDCPDLVALMGNHSSDHGPIWSPTAEGLGHHLLNAPENFAITARDKNGVIIGAAGCYVLEYLRDDQVSRMFICETLIADDPAVANQLMRTAHAHATELGLRGIVVENATHLNADIHAACGLLKTPRRMIFAMRGRSLPDVSPTMFGLDIK